MAFDGHLRALWDGSPDEFRAGFHEYVEAIGEYRELARAYPGTNQISGMYLREVADRMVLAHGDGASTDWRQGMDAAMWMLLGAYLRDLPPLPPKAGT